MPSDPARQSMEPENRGAVDRLRAEVAESDAAIASLISVFERDLKRAQRRRSRIVEKLRAALDEGYGVYFSTDTGSWQPRREPLAVVVVKHDEQAMTLAETSAPVPQVCNCRPHTGFHAPGCAAVEVEREAARAA